ncbi:MAG: mxaS, partial [Pseudomonadota bacterium]
MTSDFFSYHINWKSSGVHPGRHKSDQRGMGIEFAGHSNLLDYPDPRRIDLRMTMRDPMEQIYVRIFNQRSATPVMIFSDLSSSMRFGDDQKNKLSQASEIAQIIKNSAFQNSDAIGFVG